MPLFLLELELPAGSPDLVVERARSVAQAAGVAVVETSLAESLGRLYVVLEAEPDPALVERFRHAELTVLEAGEVRLVGTPAAADGEAPSHLVEWDLPKHLKMEQYLARKAEKTPLYAQAKDVAFLRTYVREDMLKCVCLYDAPDEAAVLRAREIVSAPVDWLARLTRDDDER